MLRNGVGIKKKMRIKNSYSIVRYFHSKNNRAICSIKGDETMGLVLNLECMTMNINSFKFS